MLNETKAVLLFGALLLLKNSGNGLVVPKEKKSKKQTNPENQETKHRITETPKIVVPNLDEIKESKVLPKEPTSVSPTSKNTVSKEDFERLIQEHKAEKERLIKREKALQNMVDGKMELDEAFSVFQDSDDPRNPFGNVRYQRTR